MSEFSVYLTRMTSSHQNSEEEKLCADIIFTDKDFQMSDKRLNNLAAYTFNKDSCLKIFAMIEKAISPTENPWKTIYKALLVLHTVVLFGPEMAIDKAIELCKFVHPLVNYNSALVKRGFFSGGGGTDYGEPVRKQAKIVDGILVRDENIRKARAEARAGQDSLVPMGNLLDDPALNQFNQEFNPAFGVSMNYGQGINSSVGAGYSLTAVPGMYEGRPDRYFDADSRRKALLVPKGNVQDSQITRDAQAPSLLDMDFQAANDIAALPPADYLPALEKQKELEAQLRQQQTQLQQLQELQKQQQHLQQLHELQRQQQAQSLHGFLLQPASATSHNTSSSNSLLDLDGPPSNMSTVSQVSNFSQHSYPVVQQQSLGLGYPNNNLVGGQVGFQPQQPTPQMMGMQIQQAPPNNLGAMGGIGGMGQPPQMWQQGSMPNMGMGMPPQPLQPQQHGISGGMMQQPYSAMSGQPPAMPNTMNAGLLGGSNMMIPPHQQPQQFGRPQQQHQYVGGMDMQSASPLMMGGSSAASPMQTPNNRIDSFGGLGMMQGQIPPVNMVPQGYPHMSQNSSMATSAYSTPPTSVTPAFGGGMYPGGNLGGGNLGAPPPIPPMAAPSGPPPPIPTSRPPPL